ncbi:MAG: HPr family phosphocarrier protein [Oscillospiraceae bacterium]|nr:HPr family phosphocarrier protein [Oscillospiraceae bacterium]
MTVKKIQFTGADVIEDIKKFVGIVSLSSHEIDVVSGRYVVDAKSIMGLFSLDLSVPLTLVVHSEECDDVIEKLKKFIAE